MLYKKFQPDKSLAPFVECYYQWEGLADEPLTVQSPPNGYSAIVFNLGRPYASSQGSANLTQVPRAFVSGQFTANYRLHLHGVISNVGAVLRPATIHNFFGIRMSQLVNARASLSFLNGIDETQLWDRINLSKTINERVTTLEELLTQHLATGKSNLSIIDEAIDYIDNCKGCITVDAVAVQLGISRRYLEKRFLEKVGISPKYYARIKRFSVLSNEIAHSKRIDWQHIVAHYGFHDQSHLVKEFIEFNQMNPTQYHLLHQEMIRHVKT
ncbi:MAG TPA: helix-turn-helix domain-containing protein [Chryseolinea sp.]|nr:helix-turn-helix domain-containing protein [Chryseolinea sp.]